MADFYEPDEDPAAVVAAFEQGTKGVTGHGGDLATALYQLRSDADRLLDMVHRHGRLWQPTAGQANPDVVRLLAGAADVYAAAQRQEQP